MRKLTPQEMRYQANQNLKRLAENRHKPKPDLPPKKQKGYNADDLIDGRELHELDEWKKLERRIAKASEKGFKGTDFNQGLWEEFDHMIEKREERFAAYDFKERRRLKGMWTRYINQERKK